MDRFRRGLILPIINIGIREKIENNCFCIGLYSESAYSEHSFHQSADNITQYEVRVFTGSHPELAWQTLQRLVTNSFRR
jgi:hypothetical protein